VLKLLLKQLAVDTPIATLAQRVRWVWAAPRRFRHPELWDLYLEDRHIDRALGALIGPADNCVDVGAHVGSMLARMRGLAPHGSHVAIEPVPRKARWLRRKFADVTVVEAATAEEQGRAMFYEVVDRPGFSGLSRPVDEARSRSVKVQSYEVRLVRLDDELASSDRIDFIKIDVEGAELATLNGADGILSAHRPAVLFECGTDPQLQRFGYKRVDLFDYFSERAYDVYSMVDFVFGRHPMTRESFEKAGTYPYSGFNYVALPVGTPVSRIL
jgi:FkbM family methyltransferase